jgi:hypothetical protein
VSRIGSRRYKRPYHPPLEDSDVRAALRAARAALPAAATVLILVDHHLDGVVFAGPEDPGARAMALALLSDTSRRVRTR